MVETGCQSVREAADDLRALDIGRNRICGSCRNLMHRINWLMLDQTLAVASPRRVHAQQPGAGRSTELLGTGYDGTEEAERQKFDA